MGWGRSKNAARPLLILLFTVLPAVYSVAWAAEYPRRIAIAPFAILGPQEEIRQTVDILPRLISSRLMALAGAEVLLLSPADKPAGDAAKKAGQTLLLNGSAAELGAGDPPGRPPRPPRTPRGGGGRYPAPGAGPRPGPRFSHGGRRTPGFQRGVGPLLTEEDRRGRQDRRRTPRGGGRGHGAR